MQQLTEKLGYTFRNPQLLREALTHPSRSAVNNQRLEFLGDAILGAIMAEKLYRAFPEAQEGELTRLRALLVCEETQSRIAQRLGLGEALMLDHGESLSGGRTKPSVLCDTMEAVLAAIFLDGGLAPVIALIDRIWPSVEELHQPQKDYKSMLQEALQVHGGEVPVYTLVDRHGPDHAPVFEVAVSHQGRELARGTGHSKKLAEKEAARAALERIGEPQTT